MNSTFGLLILLSMLSVASFAQEQKHPLQVYDGTSELEYQFDQESGYCKNKNGMPGYNENLWGPCGQIVDLTLTPETKHLYSLEKMTSVSLQGSMWMNVNIVGQDLSGLKLSNSRLMNVNFINSFLHHADLSESEGMYLNLINTRADGLKLHGKKVEKKEESAFMSGSTFIDAYFRGGSYKNADFSNMNFSGLRFSMDQTDVLESNFENTTFNARFTHLSDSSFHKSNFKNVVFGETKTTMEVPEEPKKGKKADPKKEPKMVTVEAPQSIEMLELSDAIFDDCNFSNSSFRANTMMMMNSSFTYADFRNAKFHTTNSSRSSIKKYLINYDFEKNRILIPMPITMYSGETYFIPNEQKEIQDLKTQIFPYFSYAQFQGADLKKLKFESTIMILGRGRDGQAKYKMALEGAKFDKNTTLFDGINASFARRRLKMEEIK